MTQLSLKARLERFLRAKHGWVAKGELADLARERTGATGEHTGRRLRELAEEGVLEVKHVRNHSWYRAKEQMSFEDYWNSLPTHTL